MGGLMRSPWQIVRERLERLRLIRDIGALHQQRAGLQRALTWAVGTVTPSVRATLDAEIAAGLAWTETTPELAEQPIDAASLPTLRQMHAELDQVVQEGERIVGRLLFTSAKKGDQLSSQLAHRLVSMRTAIAKHGAECAEWFPTEIRQWSADLERAGTLHDQERLDAAAEQLEHLETNIHQIVAKTRDLRAKQQSRMYLLRAVRQVCCSLGMREVGPPRQQHTDDPSSRILLTVASPDRGRISLALTLDGIQSRGEAPKCGKDLEHLSEQLAAGFGIQTKFRRPDDHDGPALTGGRRRRLPPGDTDAQTQAAEA